MVKKNNFSYFLVFDCFLSVKSEKTLNWYIQVFNKSCKVNVSGEEQRKTNIFMPGFGHFWTFSWEYCLRPASATSWSPWLVILSKRNVSKRQSAMAKFRRSPKFGKKHPCSKGSGGGPVHPDTGINYEAHQMMPWVSSRNPKALHKGITNHCKTAYFALDRPTLG